MNIKTSNYSFQQWIDLLGRYRYWWLIPIFLIVTFILISSKYNESSRIDSCINNCERDINLLINGIVIDKALVGNNHRGTETIKILNDTGDTLKYYGGWHPNLNFLLVGDSIYKRTGEFHFEIYRNNKKVKTVYGECDECESLCENGYKNCNK